MAENIRDIGLDSLRVNYLDINNEMHEGTLATTKDLYRMLAQVSECMDTFVVNLESAYKLEVKEAVPDEDLITKAYGVIFPAEDLL